MFRAVEHPTHAFNVGVSIKMRFSAVTLRPIAKVFATRFRIVPLQRRPFDVVELEQTVYSNVKRMLCIYHCSPKVIYTRGWRGAFT